MSYRRDFTKPYHVELIANKKAVQLKKDGIEWHEISKQLNISCEELNHIIENYNQIQTNDRATGTIIEPINSVNLQTVILLEDAEH
jgi:hypothetical protein